MNWLINILQKEARRFSVDDRVRFYTGLTKGRGKGVVYSPSFTKGKVKKYDADNKRYVIVDPNSGEEIMVHPRNLIPDSIRQMEPPSDSVELNNPTDVLPDISPDVAL